MAATPPNVDGTLQIPFSGTYDLGSLAKPPRFNPSNFGLWKNRMLLFLEGIDSRYPNILSEGPIVPKIWARFGPQKDAEGKDIESDDDERSDKTGRYIIKPSNKYNEDDKRLVALDTKVKSALAVSLPDEVYHSLLNLSTAKEMWDTLSVLYEGTKEVRKSNKICLVRKYELFSHEKGESLPAYFNRFNCLLNDLKVLGKVYDNEEVLCKFMDCLPDFWETICTCIKQTKDLEQMPLTALYGTLMNYEQTKNQRKSLIKDIKSSSSIALIGESKSSSCVPRITYPSSESENETKEDSSHLSEAYFSAADDEGEESAIDILSDSMAMIAGNLKNKRFSSNRSKFQRKPLSQKPLSDKANEECFNCGKKGHFASVCRSKAFSKHKSSSSGHDFSKSASRKPEERSSQSSKENHESKESSGYRKYKAKYRREKEKNLSKGKTLVAETHCWEDEQTSESESEYVTKCLMAKIDELEEMERSLHITALVSTEGSTSGTKSQVHPFTFLSNDQKIDAFDSLTVDFCNLKEQKKKADLHIKSLNDQLLSCFSKLKDFDKMKADLENLRYLNDSLSEEKNKISNTLEKEQEVLSKWTKSSKNLERILQDQISCNDKTGLGFGKDDPQTSESQNPSSECQGFPAGFHPSDDDLLDDLLDYSSEDSTSVHSIDLLDMLKVESSVKKFGVFVKAKDHSPEPSNDLTLPSSSSKPIQNLLNSLSLRESRNSSDECSLPKPPVLERTSYFQKKNGSESNISSKRKSQIVTDFVPRSVNLKKSKNPGKGILGPRPGIGHSSSQSATLSQDFNSMDFKRAFTIKKCYNCGNTLHLAKDCPKDNDLRRNNKMPSNPKGPISKWVPRV